MEFFCGLDVGMDQIAICVVDDKGGVLLEIAVMTDPEVMKGALSPYLGRLRRSATRPARCRISRPRRATGCGCC